MMLLQSIAAAAKATTQASTHGRLDHTLYVKDEYVKTAIPMKESIFGRATIDIDVRSVMASIVKI